MPLPTRQQTDSPSPETSISAAVQGPVEALLNNHSVVRGVLRHDIERTLVPAVSQEIDAGGPP